MKICLPHKYPYYVDQVLDEEINRYGLSQDDLLTGGYQIYTELDQSKQTAMEKTYQKVKEIKRKARCKTCLFLVINLSEKM
ncbi:hypothetical protein [Neobacillus ginsengisoli]|uniref:Membrane peptidoglycan carboxypeptidase n=1 Tax=Neobacillus ginsengisoli TaxID=904295 RepID=A0ABT9XR96_9BACI|nr:hypothetical protein [Neobacillus ginsengisoli]MDQ0198080.1 membrane peptidoglycan carboxypeptidase [Neobacillus ginsengisoli]